MAQEKAPLSWADMQDLRLPERIVVWLMAKLILTLFMPFIATMLYVASVMDTKSCGLVMQRIGGRLTGDEEIDDKLIEKMGYASMEVDIIGPTGRYKVKYYQKCRSCGKRAWQYMKKPKYGGAQEVDGIIFNGNEHRKGGQLMNSIVRCQKCWSIMDLEDINKEGKIIIELEQIV